MDINDPQNYYHVPHNKPLHCYIVNVTAEHGYWQSENPLSQALPLLAWQLSIVIMINRVLFYLFKPLGTPRIVTDILAGILIGPSLLSKSRFFAGLFPLRSIFIVETVSFWALTCHLFLTGLEIDMTSILRAGNKSIGLAIVGTVLPFIMGICLYLIEASFRGGPYRSSGCVFWGAALSITSYPVVARVLADQKLLHIDIGRLAMSISIISEVFAWLMVSVLIPASVGPMNAILSLIATTGFVAFCFTAIRPFLVFIIKKSTNGNKYSEYCLCFILVSVSFFSLASDLLGTTSIVGAFVFGIIMPNRVLASALLEKFEDFITAYLLPLFFASMGIRLDIWSISNWILDLVMIILFCSVKIISIFLASHYYQLTREDGFALGVLMNTKGILTLIILNMGFDKSILLQEDYVVMMLAILVMTGIVPPIISSIYNPNKRLSHYKQRTIVHARPDTEFRMLACFQSSRNVVGMIHLIDCSNATKESPLTIFALHLVELTGRASAMLIVHNGNKSGGTSRNAYSEQIISSLETYANLNELVAMHPLTALSPFATMHEDICCLAEDKEVGFLILPFHKLPTPDGKLEEDGSTSFRGVNLNVLADAPCTVGIFVDRGFGAVGESNLTLRQIAMFFIGGPDDREALSFAWRMGLTHGVSLTVVRFIPGEGVEDALRQQQQQQKHPNSVDIAVRTLSNTSFVDRQKKLDDEFVNEFRLKSAGVEFMSYEEKIVNNDEDIIQELKGMHHIYDLYVVGRSEVMQSSLTAGLMDWCEFPELGAMGDLLVTSTFSQGSVLVVQQYAGYEEDEDEDDNKDEEEGSVSNSLNSLEGSRLRATETVNDGGLVMEPFHKSDERV